MSSSVCQGLQSCLEPRLVESRFLRLKLAPPKPIFSGSIAPNPCNFPSPAPPEPQSLPSVEEKNTPNKNNNANDCKLPVQDVANQNIDMGGWSFLQSLTTATANATANAKESTEHDKVYVHPLVKRSASMLNAKSLEMCTESLGSETGSEVSESHDDISLETLVCNSPTKPRESLMIRKMTRSSSFPPPLTSISGSNGVQVKSHREGGRLLLQAVSIPPCQSYFHAERSEGRLRLSLLKDATPIFDIEGSDDEEQEEVVEEEDAEIVYYEDEDEDEDENGVEGEIEEEEEEEECCWDEDIEGNNGNVGGEIETGKLARPSSCCKESGRGQHQVQRLLNWEPFWVAT
ncbi:hypothetical protein CCACVL1_14862 [Corchorus capsularis]|uniref:FAF domain-containing protein n=1 Tax=Corchorus capsularis TaxID=210143 RepID=A0A1R3I527_COCAP|nr:hypothetical protein CCACVL1_14862 [Corchorus capsularis]